jgi:large subunit ribosomal protein L4
MPTIPLYDMDGNEKGSLSLSDAVFGALPNVALMHQAVQTEEANQRQGTADTKKRGEVRGGGRKPYRQKGTGRARQGSTRAPHWRHGGVVFGPHPRSYTKALPKKMRRGALRSALSAKVADGEVIGLDVLTVEVVKTKRVVEILDKLPLKRQVNTKHWDADGQQRGTAERPQKVLVIVPAYDETLLKSCRNIPYVTLRHAPNFSVRDVIAAGRVLLAEGAVAAIEEVLAG